MTQFHNIQEVHDSMRTLLLTTADAMKQNAQTQRRALVGFDGFIDKIVRVVDKRTDFENYIPIETMTQFAQRIERAAGLSTNIELVPKQIKLGGNGPIMGNALVAAGMDITYIGSLGKTSIHPVFRDFADRCAATYSIADPGETDAVEFQDGKVMLGKTESMKDITWSAIIDTVGSDQLANLFHQVDLVAFVNWTMLPYATDIWKTLTDEFLPELSVKEEKPWLFVDLADPEKRRTEELVEAVQHIRHFASHFRPVLGLNRKEATEVSNALGLSLSVPPEEAQLSEIVPAIGRVLQLAGVVVHPIDCAAAYFDDEYVEVGGPHTSNPFLTTGAGDNFNAGFCNALVNGLTPEQALVLGNATSGFYVRNGHSPNFDQLVEFVRVWSDHIGQDF